MTNDLRTRLLARSPDYSVVLNYKQERPQKLNNPDGPEAVAALDERDELLREVREWTRNGACADRTLSLMSRIDALLANTPPTPDPRDERIKALEALLVEADLEFRALGEGYTIRKRIDTLLNPTPVKE